MAQRDPTTDEQYVKNLEKEVQLLRMLKDLEIKRNAGQALGGAPVMTSAAAPNPRLGHVAQLRRGPRGKSESFYVVRTSSGSGGGAIDPLAKRDGYRGAVAATAPGADRWGVRSDKEVRTSRFDKADGRGRDQGDDDDRQKRGNSLERKAGRGGHGGGDRGGRDMERDRDRERERDRGGRDREERRPRPPDRRNTTMSLGDYMNPKDKAAQRGGGGGGGVPARSQCTPLTNLLEETPAESLATELIIVESSESVETALQLLGEFRFTSLPVRTNDGRMDKMIDIYDVIAYLLTRALQASKEDLLSKMGEIMTQHTVHDVLNSISKYKPSWQQCGVGSRDPLASIVKVLSKEIQQFPLGPSGHDGKVIKQSSLLWFLKQNSRRYINTLRGTSVNYLRYLTTNSTMAPKNTKVVELLTLMVKKKCPMVAITDNSGALLTTFSFSCLRGLNRHNCSTLDMNVFEFFELTKQPVPVPVFCVPNTSVDTVIELMNEKQGENGVWVINENKVPLEMLHCTDLIRFLLLKEKKQREDLEEKDQYLEWDRRGPKANTVIPNYADDRDNDRRDRRSRSRERSRGAANNRGRRSRSRSRSRTRSRSRSSSRGRRSRRTPSRSRSRTRSRSRSPRDRGRRDRRSRSRSPRRSRSRSRERRGPGRRQYGDSDSDDDLAPNIRSGGGGPAPRRGSMRRGRDADGGFEDGHYDDRDDEGAGGRRRAPSSLNNNNNNNNSEETTTSGTVYLTHQGWMCKRSPAFHKKWQRRWFELRGNVLVYFRDVKDKSEACGSIMLNNHFEVVDGQDNEFALKMMKRTYILQAPTEKEKTDWMNILQRAKQLPEP